ncbi:12-oxophytodienoate reductase [Arthrobacter sp. zg-Y820]|uniref:oxidoreductase n=1 Tax=unclassified Arthrobacter TaxID=235627 RepID=UPI00253FB90A|nr:MULTISPECIES: 12-oxophytodienoate reductase [unclassified Arthrobacter]MCC9197897.1 12-oxophytodienoate reductase [Arthrobacter sp. zg-Y820]MDK1280764.1 12-oxophytodienoate reductase [Arthrobacter sp. zg.Y820]MDK1360894.1 12-oxophytodienoate reductase [Arthrobacter sp. zg-Y1219]WIB10610.1 12-oxophytodienoate reductase [Arthrobacter sp. zg-Y820]
MTTEYDSAETELSAAADPLFRELTVRSLHLRNRIVMSPMTRTYSPGGVPGEDVARYYRRRAEGGTGLIITEGVAIDHSASVDHASVPNMFASSALDGWRSVVDGVHEAGGRIIPQLWHVGPLWGAMGGSAGVTPMRPSGLWGTPGITNYSAEYVRASEPVTRAMTTADIESVIAAFRVAARSAVDAGFDGIALHGGHGYLLDAFLWADTNRRDDEWGGDPERRAAFPAAVVRAIREEIGEELPIFFRFSQHKQQDFGARLADTPEELGALLRPLVAAGVDVLDASARRFQAPAFEGSDLSLAGWAKQLTGARTMAVGSVGIGSALKDRRSSGNPILDNRAELTQRLGADEFDLIAIGRLHLADADIVQTLRDGRPLPQYDYAKHESSLL